MSPVRIQRRRTKGWRMPEDATYVGRPSRWGNPYQVGETYFVNPPFPFPTHRGPGEYHAGIVVERLGAPSDAVAWFVHWAHSMVRSEPDWLAPLRGHDLACWCPLDQPCHADVLLELANR